jgi:transcription elongation factor GreA
MEGKTFFITKSKLQELKAEYDKLLELERTKTIGEEAPKIFESEDLNPEFVSFQEDMGFLRSRIDEIKNILENYELIKKPEKEKANFVNLGAKVIVDTAGQKIIYYCGDHRGKTHGAKISDESRWARPYGQKNRDEITIDSPAKPPIK